VWAEWTEAIAATFAVTGAIEERVRRLEALTGVRATVDRVGNALLRRGSAGTVVALGADDPTLVVTGEGPEEDGAAFLGGRAEALRGTRAVDAGGRSWLVRVEGEGDEALVRVPGGPPPGTALRVGPAPALAAGRLSGPGAGLIGLLVGAAAWLAETADGALLLLAHGRLSPRGLEGALPDETEGVVLPVLHGGPSVAVGGTVPASTWPSLPDAPRVFLSPDEVPAVRAVRAAGAAYALLGLPAAGIGQAWESLRVKDLATFARLLGEVVAGRR
jgi:hypothetical protein